MAGFLTDYANDKVLDQVFETSTWTPPATFYPILSILTALKSDGGSERVEVANNLSNSPSAPCGIKLNGTPVTHPTPTANWGTIAISFVGGILIVGDAIAMAGLPASKAINPGPSAPKIAAGALLISHL